MNQPMRLWQFSSSVHSSNAHVQPSCGARCLIFGRTLHLLPYFMCANSEGSSKTAQMHRLAWAFAGCICDKYQNLMSWLICLFFFTFPTALSSHHCYFPISLPIPTSPLSAHQPSSSVLWPVVEQPQDPPAPCLGSRWVLKVVVLFERSPRQVVSGQFQAPFVSHPDGNKICISRFILLHKKAVLHAINSHVFTGTNPCIIKAIHTQLIHGFAVLRICIPGPSQNLSSLSVTCMVVNVISRRQNEVIICPGSGVFMETFAGNVPFCTILGTWRENFSKHFFQSFQVIKCYAIIVINHDFLIHLHLLPFQARVSTPPSGPSRC